MRLFAAALVLLAARAPATDARGWAWPEGSESIRIDTKVRFLDDKRDGDKAVIAATAATTAVATATATATATTHTRKRVSIQSDEVPFDEAVGRTRQYRRPSEASRAPALIAANHRGAYRIDKKSVYPVQSTNNDGTLDSIQFCKCVDTPECNPRYNSAEICGTDKYLCCFKRPNKRPSQKNSEYFNELDDERPMLYPGKEEFRSPFPPPPNSADTRARPQFNDLHQNHAHTGSTSSHIGPDGHTGHYNADHRQVLAGPGGLTGYIGPTDKQLLVSPTGFTGNFGPHQPGFLDPESPTGIIKTHHQVLVGPDGEFPQKQVLAGPEGPTGIIGPPRIGHNIGNIQTDETAQRGVLVGPGGPTGVIGPYNQQQLLVGPGGPTGQVDVRGGGRGLLVGPGGPTGDIGPGFGRQTGSGVLVGPGGPTGSIGPGRRLLVGPGGPTGHIGPQPYFGN